MAVCCRIGGNMIQKKYLYKNLSAAEEAIPEIRSILEETPHKAALITFYEKGLAAGDVEAYLMRIKEPGFPELKFAGISLTMIAELMPEGEGILLNLILTEEADIDVITIPSFPGGEDDAADELKKELDAKADVKVVELFSSNMLLNNTRFIERAMEGHEDTVLFGTTTIKNLPAKMSVADESNTVEIEHMDMSYVSNEYIFGDGILTDGFVAVVFSGEKLAVQANYALGWSPIGRRLYTDLAPSQDKGETVVYTINNAPAVDIYKEYLGVYPDPYLISNICEFPLMVEREGINICLIPLDCGKNGELYFMMSLRKGERLRLSFASHDEVLNACRGSLLQMEDFKPEALFLSLCGNRINFLKEDAHLEWDGFNKISPNHALMHGACELYYHKGKGGILNSAHLAIGLKEKERAGEDKENSYLEVESLRHGRTLPLSDRMSVFLSKITSELKELANEADHANKAKSAFLSHMSHEIRTPINAILGMDEMILRESGEEAILDYAEDIRSAGNNLLGIVNDVLDFSKIEAGKMTIIPGEYEIRSIINDLYNIVRMRADSKGLKVILDIDPSMPSVLLGDENRIKQVVVNILTNAVKYTDEGSVTLGIKKIADGGPEDMEALKLACPGEDIPDRSVKLRVTVKDTGIGIRPEDIKRLFDKYERMDERRNRMVEGTGLGLNISKQLLELMGSRLVVDSIYGVGSEFGFEIIQGVASDEPVGEVKGRLKNTEHHRYHVRFTAEDARILVVDDTRVNLDVIRNLLKETKIQVDMALSGEEALELVRNNEYDVIFLDHLMPNMDGPETLEHMKRMKDNRSENAPVISLTANALSGARDQYLKAGFKDYLSKPVDPQDLEDMLFNYISPEKIRTVRKHDGRPVREVKSPLPEWLTKISGIDAETGLKNCSTVEIYITALECFYEVIDENADEIEEYWKKKDWENYVIKVHALRSSAKLVGASAIAEQADILEKAGHASDTETISENTEKLLTDYRALKEELSAYITSTS